MPDDPALHIFPDEFVPNVQASDTYKRWAKSSPKDKARWEPFRDFLLHGRTPAIPAMSTVFGKALVAAGKEHMSITQLVGQVTNPYPPPDDPGSFTTQEVDGGLAYYGQFSNALPTTPDYFPIGVWGAYAQTEANLRDLDAAVGVNTYVWAADPSCLASIRADGRFRAFCQSDAIGLQGSETAGWVLYDEIDMVQANEAGAAAARAQLDTILAGLPSDNRLRYNNYGKGVAFWNSESDAAAYMNYQQVVSMDIYWFTDPDSHTQYQGGKIFAGSTRNLTPEENRRASNYGWNVERLRSLISPARSKPVWAFVEVGRPFSGTGPEITGPEIRAATWHSIISGARGIIYFQHAWGGVCYPDHHLLRSGCGPGQATCTVLDAQIKALAPALNSPTVVSGLSWSSSVKAIGKWDGATLHVIAGSKENTSSTATFTAPSLGNRTATVVDEARTIPVVNGVWQDSFADGNSIHIYRI